MFIFKPGTSDAVYPLIDTENGVPASPFFLIMEETRWKTYMSMTLKVRLWC